MTYAAHWARCWSLIGAVGIGLSFLVWEPLSVLTVFVTAAVCAAVLLVLLTPDAAPRTTLSAVRWTRILARAGLAGATVVALGAVSTAVPALALPAVLVALATCPAVVDHVREWRRSRAAAHVTPVRDGWPEQPLPDRPAPADRPLDVTDAAARAMTDQELCRQWRHSFVTLQSARSAQELARVVAQRQVYLDEMERRSPTALKAWLDSGARAAGGPERFLTRRPHDDRSDDQSDAA